MRALHICRKGPSEASRLRWQWEAVCWTTTRIADCGLSLPGLDPSLTWLATASAFQAYPHPNPGRGDHQSAGSKAGTRMASANTELSRISSCKIKDLRTPYCWKSKNPFIFRSNNQHKSRHSDFVRTLNVCSLAELCTLLVKGWAVQLHTLFARMS